MAVLASSSRSPGLNNSGSANVISMARSRPSNPDSICSAKLSGQMVLTQSGAASRSTVRSLTTSASAAEECASAPLIFTSSPADLKLRVPPGNATATSPTSTRPDNSCHSGASVASFGLKSSPEGGPRSAWATNKRQSSQNAAARSPITALSAVAAPCRVSPAGDSSPPSPTMDDFSLDAAADCVLRASTAPAPPGLKRNSPAPPLCVRTQCCISAPALDFTSALTSPSASLARKNSGAAGSNGASKRKPSKARVPLSPLPPAPNDRVGRLARWASLPPSSVGVMRLTQGETFNATGASAAATALARSQVRT